MKKFAFCFTLFCFCILSLAAKEASQISKNKVVIFTDVADVPSSEQNWLGVSVADKLETNLTHYTDFVFINRVNQKQILDIQKEYEGQIYDSSTALKVGELVQANYGLFVTIKKGGSKYTVTIRYTDLTSGKNITTVNGNGDSTDELYIGHGCTIDLLTIDLCDALNIPLTQTEKYIIMNGEKDLTADQKAKLYDEKIKLFEAQIVDLNKKIESASVSSDIKDDTYKKMLESEKKLADEKLRVVRENQRRAEEEAAKRREDAERDAKRSAAQREKIEEMSLELKKKYEILRSKKLDNEPILGRIKVIELKKKALLEIQADIDQEIEILNIQTNEKIEKKHDEIMNRPISVVEQGEYADTLSEGAKANRAREFELAKQEIIDNLKDDAKHLNDELIKENKKLLNEIHKDYNGLKNVVVSSLSDDLTVDFGNYDGNKGGWPLFITVKSDDIIIFKTKAFLSYKELTGKEFIRDSRDPNYKEFAIDVDTYESLFLRGEPILTFEIEYTVSPYAPEHPSKYKFKFHYLKYYDTRKVSMWGGKLRASKTGFLYLDNDTISRQFEPIYNIRAIEDKETASIKIDNIAYDDGDDRSSLDNNNSDYRDYYEDDYYDYDYNEREEKRQREERKRMEKQLEEQEKARKKAEKSNNGRLDSYPLPHNLVGINFGFGMGGVEGPSVEMELDFAFTDFIYWGISSTSFFPTKALGYEIMPDISYLMTNQIKTGINLDLFLCNVYSSVGIGANYFTYLANFVDETTTLPFDIPNEVTFIYTFEVGASIQLSRYFAISCGYMSVFYDENGNKYDNLDFGVALTF